MPCNSGPSVRDAVSYFMRPSAGYLAKMSVIFFELISSIVAIRIGGWYSILIPSLCLCFSNGCVLNLSQHPLTHLSYPLLFVHAMEVLWVSSIAVVFPCCSQSRHFLPYSGAYAACDACSSSNSIEYDFRYALSIYTSTIPHRDSSAYAYQFRISRSTRLLNLLVFFWFGRRCWDWLISSPWVRCPFVQQE